MTANAECAMRSLPVDFIPKDQESNDDMMEGLHQINQTPNEDALEEVMIEPEVGVNVTGTEHQTFPASSTTIPNSLTASTLDTPPTTIPTPIAASLLSPSTVATIPAPLAASPLPSSTGALQCFPNSQGFRTPAPSIFCGIRQTLGSAAPSITEIRPMVIDLPVVPPLATSIPELDEDEEEVPIITRWSTVYPPSSPLAVASPLLAEGSTAATAECTSVIPDYTNWSVFDCNGFKWLIGGAESWGDWQACVRTFVNFRVQAGSLVRLLALYWHILKTDYNVDRL